MAQTRGLSDVKTQQGPLHERLSELIREFETRLTPEQRDRYKALRLIGVLPLDALLHIEDDAQYPGHREGGR
jgi:hypothetical protein